MILRSRRHRWRSGFSLSQVRENRNDDRRVGYRRQHFEPAATLGAHAEINVVDPTQPLHPGHRGLLGASLGLLSGAGYANAWFRHQQRPLGPFDGLRVHLKPKLGARRKTRRPFNLERNARPVMCCVVRDEMDGTLLSPSCDVSVQPLARVWIALVHCGFTWALIGDGSPAGQLRVTTDCVRCAALP